MAELIDLTILRIVCGLFVAAHGAQKVFGVWGGPGIEGFSRMVGGMRFHPPRMWASIVGYGELLGGLAFALGLFTPLVAAVLAVDMLVAIREVHWRKGFFNTGGGYEYPAILTTVFTLVGLTGGGAYSIDGLLGMPYPSPLTFVVAAGVGAAMAIPGQQRQRVGEMREKRAA